MHSHLGVFEEKITSAKNHEEIYEFLSFIKDLPIRNFLHIQYVYFRGDFAAYFDQIKLSKCSFESLNPKVGAYRFTIKQSDSTIKGSFYTQETVYPDLYMVISISRTSTWNAFLQLVLQRQYPRTVLLYWKQTEITKALRILEEHLIDRYALRVKRLSLKEKRESGKEQSDAGSKPAKAKYDSYLEWTSKTLSQILDEAKEREQWFKKIVFELFPLKDGFSSSAAYALSSISKYGYISCDNLFHSVIPILREELEPPLNERIQLFKSRGLKERKYRPSTAITIKYPDDIFKDKSIFEHFSNIIKKYPNSTKALFHTNPYYHASIADFLDGSSLDIRISDYKSLIIIPQIQTSISSLERLITYIFDNFYEGIVEEYKSVNE